MTLLTAPEEGEFAWHEVSTRVNRVANDDAQLILPITAEQREAEAAGEEGAPRKPVAPSKDDGQGSLVLTVAWLRALEAPSNCFSFSTALSGVVSTGRPEASATIAAAGAMLYCASAIRSQSRRSRAASATSRSCSARSPRSRAASAPSASFGTTSTQRGNSGGIDASVGGNVESKPILGRGKRPARSSPRWA